MGRQELLDILVDEGITTGEDRELVMAYSKETDDDAIILGYVKGLPGTRRPKDIAAAIGIDVSDVQAADKRTAPPSYTLRGVGEVFEKGEGMDYEGMREALESSDEKRAESETRIETAKAAIEQALAAGEITDEQAAQWQSKLRPVLGMGQWGGDRLKNIDEVFSEISVLEDVTGAIKEDVDREAKRVGTARSEEEQERFLEAREAEERTDPFGRTGFGAAGTPAPDGEERDLLAEIPANTWLGALSQAGFLYVDDDPESDSYGAVVRSPQAPRILADEPLMDPATGRFYTNEMIEQFRDNIIRATTESLDPTTRAIAAAAVQDVIDAPLGRAPEGGGEGRAARAIRAQGYDPLTGEPLPGRMQMPQDPFLPTLFADDPFEMELYTYAPGQAQFMWDQMTASQRRSWTNDMVRSGTLDDEDAAELDPTDLTGATQVLILGYAMETSQRKQVGLRQAIVDNGHNDAAYRAKQDRADAVARAFSIPASLREIPGPKTLAQEAKDRFSRVLGREVLDDELAGLVPGLQGQYEQSTQQRIALALAAFEGDNQGLLTGAQLQQIEDPGAATSFDIEEKWASEIDLNNRREDNSTTFNRMLNATMGGRASIGGQTAAGGVQRIGR